MPATALIHQKMFTIFGMISRLPNSILHNHARDVLTISKTSTRSWFYQIRDLCLLYGLPHPLEILKSPGTKSSYKNFVKKRIIDHWEMKLRQEAHQLSSLRYFKPNFMNLTSPHPLWTTAGSSPYQVTMATIQAVMLSRRYRTQQLLRHWSSSSDGSCQAPGCTGTQQPEDLHHILAL